MWPSLLSIVSTVRSVSVKLWFFTGRTWHLSSVAKESLSAGEGIFLSLGDPMAGHFLKVIVNRDWIIFWKIFFWNSMILLNVVFPEGILNNDFSGQNTCRAFAIALLLFFELLSVHKITFNPDGQVCKWNWKCIHVEQVAHIQTEIPFWIKCVNCGNLTPLGVVDCSSSIQSNVRAAHAFIYRL